MEIKLNCQVNEAIRCTKGLCKTRNVKRYQYHRYFKLVIALLLIITGADTAFHKFIWK